MLPTVYDVYKRDLMYAFCKLYARDTVKKSVLLDFQVFLTPSTLAFSHHNTVFFLSSLSFICDAEVMRFMPYYKPISMFNKICWILTIYALKRRSIFNSITYARCKRVCWLTARYLALPTRKRASVVEAKRYSYANVGCAHWWKQTPGPVARSANRRETKNVCWHHKNRTVISICKQTETGAAHSTST